MIKKSNIYLLVGENEISKLNKIKKLKNELLSNSIQDFNLQVLSAKALNLKALEEALLFLPVKTKKSLLIIRNVEDLPKECKEKLISYIKKPSPQLILILEATHLDKDIERITKYAQTLYFYSVRQYNTFDLAKAIRNKNQTFALSVLSNLLERGEKPQKILGGLIWQWEQMAKYLSREKIDKGFKILLETDLNIKSSRLTMKTALEISIIKLILLI
jgi:DNA polymerase III delta subunit